MFSITCPMLRCTRCCYRAPYSHSCHDSVRLSSKLLCLVSSALRGVEDRIQISERGLFLLPPPPTRLSLVPGASPAPLSPSSGGLAGRSDQERGGRPPCTACRFGFDSDFGGLPWLSFTSAPSGGADGRRAPPPLLRPWRAAARAGSGLSSMNKPAMPGWRPIAS
jgi:hypothetical protein